MSLKMSFLFQEKYFVIIDLYTILIITVQNLLKINSKK